MSGIHKGMDQMDASGFRPAFMQDRGVLPWCNLDVHQRPTTLFQVSSRN